MIHLRLLGGASLEDESGPLAGPAAQRHRIALLALLAASPARGLAREKVMALLWPERDTENARKLLNQSVYVLRKTLGEDSIRSPGEELRLSSGRIRCDLVAFERALAGDDLERAVELYTGPFLDGFHLDAAPAFERWQAAQRARLDRAYGKALETLADAAERRGAIRRAVEWWAVRARQDPYDSRVALRLMHALASSGNPAGALRHAAEHERLLREELGIEPVAEIRALTERLRRESVGEARRDGEETVVDPGPPRIRAKAEVAGSSDVGFHA
ncbi:MAG: BTAD domain-containing putative transcriptional regulator, partial [Gemmatimonadota bacterium]|nr:BTAD domain-containing putative transcriptional regulator [Gemmatimonadota bacterium]